MKANEVNLEKIMGSLVGGAAGNVTEIINSSTFTSVNDALRNGLI